MSNHNFQGVDLTTGKLLLPLQIATVTGPNDFGESLTLQYSTLGLMTKIKTWNEDAPTGVAGLGWSLTTPQITRLGIGSINDTFVLNGTVLTLQSQTGNSTNGYTLIFKTSTQSLLKIAYTSQNEKWSVTDGDGIIYVYGLEPHALEYGVSWQGSSTSFQVPQNSIDQSQTPGLWSGESLQNTSNQVQFVKHWNLLSKKNVFDQQVNYFYNKTEYNVGTKGEGALYTLASYLTHIEMMNGGTLGERLELNYQSKFSWEYPVLRLMYNSDGTLNNAYQDRFITQYLSSVVHFHPTGVIHAVYQFTYGFLWDHFGTQVTSSPYFLSMNKRILLSLSVLTPDGILTQPPTQFDYWGYGNATGDNTNDGFKNHYDSIDILKMKNSDFSAATPYPYQDAAGNNYYQLFGHLKNIQSPSGALTWYSYRELSQNYKEFDDDFDSVWILKLSNHEDPIFEPPQTYNGESVAWEKPRPYWGPDGFVVIRWYSTEKGYDGNYYLMHVQAYEWLGQWVNVYQETFDIYWWKYDLTEDYNFIQTGPGFFAIMRTDIACVSGQGNGGAITLVSRDAYLPGTWHATSFLADGTIIGYKTKPPYTLQYMAGQNVFACLDRSCSSENNYVNILYAYGYRGEYDASGNVVQLWDTLTLQSEGHANNLDIAAVGANGNTVLFYFIPPGTQEVITQVYYCLYDLNAPAKGLTTQDNTYWIVNQFSLSTDLDQYTYQQQQYAGTTEATIQSVGSAPSTYWIVNNYSFTDAGLGTNYFIRQYILSYTDEGTLTQQILPVNSRADDSPYWGYGTGSKFLFNGSNGNPLTVTSDFITDTANRDKTIFNFTGSNQPLPGFSANNGWLKRIFNNSEKNNDLWAITPTISGTTVEVVPADTDKSDTPQNTYNFWQYDPNLGWQQQVQIEITATDWDYIEEMVGLAFEIVNLGSIIFIFSPFIAIEGLGAEALIEAIPLAGTLIKGQMELVSTLYEITNELLQIAGFGAFQTSLTNIIMRNASDNARSGSLLGNRYLAICKGQGDLNGSSYKASQPSFYYKTWTSSNGTVWSSSLNLTLNLAPLPPFDGTATAYVPFDTYTYGDHFITFPLLLYYYNNHSGNGIEIKMPSDQCALLRNGVVQRCLLMPTYSVDYKGGFDIPYIITDTYNSDSQPALMAAPWGGILGYANYNSELYDSSFMVDYGMGSYGTKIDLQGLIKLALFLVKDESVSTLTDYVVNEVAIEDGYQTVHHHFQFMPQQAAFDNTLNSVRYNQTRVASGASTYTASAQQQGWSEYYFYTGNPLNQTLPFDPLNGDNDFDTQNASQTNTTSFPNIVKGVCYCQRSLISQDGSEFTQGFEMERQETFYKAFLNPLTNSVGQTLGILNIRGFLPTLSVQFSCANLSIGTDLLQADIYNACTAGWATLKASYTYYDLVNFYGPWLPNNPDQNYYLWIPNPDNSSEELLLQTALPLASLSYNYRYDPDPTSSNAITVIEGFYHQRIPGITTTPDTPFLTENLYHVTAQVMTWYCTGISPATGYSFPLPASSWGTESDPTWQIIASKAAPWQPILSPSSEGLWYPIGRYAWQGNADGTVWNDSTLSFPWSSPPTNSQDPTPVWLQQTSTPTLLNDNGLVVNSQSPTMIPSQMIYDRYGNLLATMINADMGVYIGFESYEDFWLWTLNTNEASYRLTSCSFSSYSYTGNRSLYLTGAVQYAISHAGGPIDTPASDFDRLWMVSFCLLSPPNQTLTINVYTGCSYPQEGDTPLLSQSITAPDTSYPEWKVYNLPLSLTQGNGNGLFTVCFDMSESGEAPLLYVDYIYFCAMQQASFSISSYDSTTQLPLTTASSQSLADYNFSSRLLYNTRGQALGVIQKADQFPGSGQPNLAATFKLTTHYFSRNNVTNQAGFNPADPNSVLTLEAGLNQAYAGFYYDGRDGVNPFVTEQTPSSAVRFIPIAAKQTLTIPLPQNSQWGIGIRLQLKGYLSTQEAVSFPSDNSQIPVGLPTPGLNPFQIWGAWCPQDKPLSYYPYFIDFSLPTPTLFTYPEATPVTPTTPLPNNQLFLCNAQYRFFGSSQGNPTDYYVYNFLENDTKLIYSSSTSLYPPVAATWDNQLILADPDQALYQVDVNNIVYGENFKTVVVLKYTTIVPSSTCPFMPVADSQQKRLAFLLLDESQQNYTLVAYDIKTREFQSCAIETDGHPLTQPPAITDEGQVVLVVNQVLQIFHISPSNELDQGFSTPLNAAPIGSLVTGNSHIYVLLATYELAIFDNQLNCIIQTPLAFSGLSLQLISSLILHGDKISVLFQDQAHNQQFYLFTYNQAGLLVAPPYPISAESASIQAFTTQQSTLCLVTNNQTFQTLDIRVPSVSMSLDKVTISWDASQNTYTATGPFVNTPDPVTVSEAYGDWLLFIVGTTLYFFADDQLIFAEALNITDLPTSLTMTASTLPVAAQDICVFQDPRVSIQYADASNKIRQVQTLADLT